MDFSNKLQGQASHEALLNRQDAEIKLLDIMRKCIAAKIKSDKDYASNIAALSIQGKKVERSEELTGSIIVQGWKEIMDSFDQTARLIRLQADSMENIVLEHISSLYTERKRIRKLYLEEQIWLNNQFRELTDEVSRKKGEYQKNLENYKQMRSRFEDNYIKSGKVGRKLDEVRDKYQKACRKLHLTHNEYVLLLGAVAECEYDLRTYFLPNLLKKQQLNHQEFIITWKKILQNVVKYTDFTNEKFSEVFTNLKKTVDSIKPTGEYQEFIGKHGTRPLSPIEFTFNENLVDDTSGKLLPNKITVDNLTIDWLRNRLTELETSLSNIQSNRQTVQSSSENCDTKLNLEFLQEEVKSRCVEKKLQKQIEIIRAALNELGCEEAPSGCDISVEGSFLDSMTKITQGISTCDIQKTAVNNELANEDWFHGVLPREDVVRLLVNKGDFLVRESIRNNESQIVLSVRWINNHKHFIVQTTPEGHYRFEGPTFPSIKDLISHQHNSKIPVTSRSGAVLITPIVRERWELNNDDVILVDKIGNGNFGDVYKARLKPSNMDVAVKTCKGTLPDEQRKKFLQEGRILKRYDHPNVVKFIGICVQKQPIMIVMELVPGGSLLVHLRNNASNIKQHQQLLMCKDTAAGMQYLESKSCIHRDLAARNCLVGYNTIIKISDFGMSREEEEYIVSDGMKQIPIKWTAPEALNFGKYTSLCDVWSYGVLMWEIFALGNSPYPGMSNMQARQKIEEGYRMSAPEGTPEEIYRLMLQCWKSAPEERPHFSQIHAVIDSILRTHN